MTPHTGIAEPLTPIDRPAVVKFFSSRQDDMITLLQNPHWLRYCVPVYQGDQIIKFIRITRSDLMEIAADAIKNSHVSTTPRADTENFVLGILLKFKNHRITFDDAVRVLTDRIHQPDNA